MDERLKLLSFTGSPGVGWDLKARCGKKKIVLELGGNAAVVVDNDTDLDDTVARIIFGAFYQSGQSCIGVQRILIHEDVYDAMKEKLVAKAATLIAGDPKDEKTFIGPMISEGEAKRLEGWIHEAVGAGATVIVWRQSRRQYAGGDADGERSAGHQCGGGKKRSVRSQSLSKFSTWDDALAEVNDSKFGLQAGHLHAGFLQDPESMGQAGGRRCRRRRRAVLPGR